MEEIRDYYAFLGVPRNATADEIKRAYARKRREYQNDETKSTQLNQAYEVLCDSAKRKQYDLNMQYGNQVEDIKDKIRNSETLEQRVKYLIDAKKIYLDILKNDVENIWRNLYFNKRQHRLVCVDRINKAGKTILGIMYVMQTESKKWPEKGVYHWDVTDMHNMQSVAISLEDFKNKSIRVMQTGTLPDVEDSRKYNSLISKADSSYMQQNYQEAERYFTHAFDFKNYVRGQHLYNAACVASLAGHKDAAFWFLEERMKAEPEWYSLNIETDKDLLPIHDDVRWNEIMNAMHERQTRKEANYDIPLRNQLLEIAKDDQSIRQEWRMTSRQQPQDKAKIDSIFSVMATIDSVNQQKIFKILDSRGFVGKDKVGDACRAYWLVVQHSSVEMQRKYLPLFLKAAERGDIPRENVAMMEDRICLFEGRPQRYGTQLEEDKDGKWHLYKLENPEKVDEYRKSVGMGTLSDYLKMMGIKL